MRNQLIAIATLSIVFGTALGNEAVSGMTLPETSTVTGADYGRASPASCVECSDYDMGYRWASLQGVTDSDECASDNWSFARGCRAFLREDRT
jgi:hypothetical protein